MKRKIILMALLAQFVCAAQAQNPIDGEYIPEPFLETGTDNPQYGYAIFKEHKKGEGKKFVFVIDYQYDEAYPFSLPVGLARVKVDGKYGFITTTNVMMIPPRFEWADNFNEKGFCRVIRDGKYGVINEKGTFVIPNKYDTLDDLLNGWYEVSKDGEWGYVHRTNIYVSSQEEYQKKRDAGLAD